MHSLLQKIFARARSLTSTIRDRWNKKSDSDPFRDAPSPTAGSRIMDSGASLLPRLAYWLRRGLPELLRPRHRTVSYDTHLSIDPETGFEILDGADYHFQLPLAGQLFRVQAAGDAQPAGHSRGLQLGLIVESETALQAWLMRFASVRRRIDSGLRHLSARILFYALTGEHREYAFSSKEYATGDWLRELYPGLHPAHFPEMGWWPPGWLRDRSGDARFWLPRRKHAALQERRRDPLRRRRRLLLIPLRARRSEIERLLPPPFHPRWRNSHDVAPDRQEVRLYLRIFLDGGPLHSKSEMQGDLRGRVAPGASSASEEIDSDAVFARPGIDAVPDLSEHEPRRSSGNENGIYMELLCPALLHADSVRTRGWIPIQARRFPLNRMTLPWDELSCSYRIRSDGLRFCLGDARRRLLGESFWRPLRGLRVGEAPPRLLRGRPSAIFVQSPVSLDVHLFQEAYTAPANRIYLLGPPPASGDGGAFPGGSAKTEARELCDYLGRKLGVALRPETHAWFASYADVATLAERRVGLHECHYRDPRPAVADLSGFPQ
ncbi:MAG: hypothetical protein NXI24_16435 [bacterium]|nr:hypothetical protein [bacterium]